MQAWKFALKYAPLALKLYNKYKGDLKLPKNFGLAQPSDEAANWESLAKHLQVQAKQRTAAVRGLRTKAGFLLVAAAFVLEPFISTRFESNVLAYIAAIALAASVALALWVMCSKTPATLDAPSLVEYLTSRPDASKLDLQKRLAKSYTAAGTKLAETYAQTQNLLRASTILLFVSIALILAANLTS
ncbi:hypothetical protein EYC59_06455 [Candidatus Saccharibacteria bacterium]|nr:MAG: hypothetical protein EYC59_06455 [Candidatus Saccharibacteria bacterium]